MIDLHCDTLLRCWLNSDYSLRENAGQLDLLRLRRGGVTAQCFAIFVPSHENAAAKGIRITPWAFYKDCLELYRRELVANGDVLAPALTAADLEKNRKDGKISAILTVEDCVGLDGKIERVEELHRDGVRMAALTWNYENSLGYPNSTNSELHSRGLKDFGLQVLEKMNHLGIVVDVSHLSEGGFRDVLRHSRKPFAASHSCALSLCQHSRNLSDEQLKAMGERGCVVGVNFNSVFLRPESSSTRTEDVLRHVEHVINTAGVDAVALGSDFDGISCELEFVDCSGMVLLRDALIGRFGYETAEKIYRLNVQRLFREVIGR